MLNWKCVQGYDWTKICVLNNSNMKFNRKVNWKCVQGYDWTKSVYLTIVTWDLTEKWP